MTSKKITSEAQAFIQQRYDDTALKIYQQQLSGGKKHRATYETTPQRGQAFGGNAAKEENMPSPGNGFVQPSRDNHVQVQSSVCVVV